MKTVNTCKCEGGEGRLYYIHICIMYVQVPFTYPHTPILFLEWTDGLCICMCMYECMWNEIWSFRLSDHYNI